MYAAGLGLKYHGWINIEQVNKSNGPVQFLMKVNARPINNGPFHRSEKFGSNELTLDALPQQQLNPTKVNAG